MIKFKRKEKKFAYIPKRCNFCRCVFWLGHYRENILGIVCEDCMKGGNGSGD